MRISDWSSVVCSSDLVVAVVAAVVFVVGGIVVAPAGLVLLGPGLPREAKRDQHGRCNQTLANAHCCSPSSGCAAQPDRATTATHRLLSQVRCQASQAIATCRRTGSFRHALAQAAARRPETGENDAQTFHGCTLTHGCTLGSNTPTRQISNL